MKPPVRSLRRRATSDNYGRKLKPTPKKTRKIRQKTKKTLKNPRKKGMQQLQIKEEIMAVAALLALGMLAIIPGIIAGSALTKSAEQVLNVKAPNVVAHVTAGVCGYLSGGDWGEFGKCMLGMWTPVAMTGALSVRGGVITMMRALVSFVRTNPWGLAVAVA